MLHLDWHWEKIQFDIIRQSESDILLERSWLQKMNPRINWAENTIHFTDTSHRVNLYPVTASSERVEIFAMITKETCEELNNLNIKILWNKWVKLNTDSITKLSIPEEYKSFQKLFTKVNDEHTLLKHQEWNHEIKIVKERKLFK